MQTVNTVFREPVQQVLEKVKNEPFFRWPRKMAGDPSKCDQNLYCHYYQDHGHATKDCRNLWNHLDQLVREGKLRYLLHPSSGHLGQAMQEPRKDVSLRPPTGTIYVILAAPGRTSSFPSRVLSVARLSVEDRERECKRSKKGSPLILGFSDEDKRGTIQPHDDALVVTVRIRGFNVRRVPEDLTAYDSPLSVSKGKLWYQKGRSDYPYKPDQR